MKLFHFYKPKQTIINILFILGLISLLITFLAIGTTILWKYYPKTVSKIDKMIPDLYGKNIKSLYIKAQEAKSEKKQLKYYQELYDELEDISTLNKYYHYRQESATYLIDYHIKNKDVNKSIKIVRKWEKNYPYDFTGKFKYIDVISYIDENNSSTYFHQLYKQHSDISEVRDAYISYLVAHKQYNRALLLSPRNHEENNQPNVNFQLFFLDGDNGFSEKQSVKYGKDDFQKKEKLYTLSFNKTFKKFHGLRFDLDKLPNGTKISNIQVTTDNQIGTFKISKINQLATLDDNTYSTFGSDPYIIFSIPEKLKNYSGRLKINISLKIDKSNPLFEKIFENKKWQFFADTGNSFNEKESIHFIFKKNNMCYLSKNIISFKNTSKVRINLPSLLSLKIKDLKLTINRKESYDKNNIVFHHNIQKVNSALEIIGNNPFLIINLNNSIDIKEFNLEILFNGSDYE